MSERTRIGTTSYELVVVLPSGQECELRPSCFTNDEEVLPILLDCRDALQARGLVAQVIADARLEWVVEREAVRGE